MAFESCVLQVNGRIICCVIRLNRGVATAQDDDDVLTSIRVDELADDAAAKVNNAHAQSHDVRTLITGRSRRLHAVARRLLHTEHDDFWTLFMAALWNRARPLYFCSVVSSSIFIFFVFFVA